MTDQRASVFIDGSNLDRAVVQCFKRRVSPERLVSKLVGDRRLMKAYYYEAPLLPEVNRESFDKQQLFFERLRINPHFEIRLGRRVEREKEFDCPECGKRVKVKTWEQKGVDSLMVFDLVSLGTRDVYDIAIVVTGDEDFITPFLEVRMLGKVVENAFTEYGWSGRLRAIADTAIILDENYLIGCWQKSK